MSVGVACVFSVYFVLVWFVYIACMDLKLVVYVSTYHVYYVNRF